MTAIMSSQSSPAARTPPDRDSDAGRTASIYRHRRRIMVGLVGGTLATAASVLGYVLDADGVQVLDGALLLCFVVSGLWPAIGAWNAIIGFILLRRHPDAPAAAVWPDLAVVPAAAPLCGRTAIVMPVYNEACDGVFANLAAVARSLADTGAADRFALHLLSDTGQPDRAIEEERRVAAWNAAPPGGLRLIYRRRTGNHGFKAGNVREFCVQAVDDYDYMLVLDADSAMDGATITRLVRILDHDPSLGIVQTLAVGAPAESAFTRLFQFGMRQGMRTYTLGSAWWQGPDGPYWGHNALLRLRAFTDHCHLPLLPGRPPVGGAILSHDQVEAVMMRRAGYAVRVLVEEGGSYEENPPTLLDFIRRDLRWCQGNMQYFRLLLWRRGGAPVPGIRPMGLVQLALAILMYLGAVAWMAFVLVGLLAIVALPAVPDPAGAAAIAARVPVGIGLFVTMVSMSMLPKLLGIADILWRRDARHAYGGTGWVLGGGLLELVVSSLLAPAIAVAQCLFIARLLRGRSLTWSVQNRAARGLGVGQALRRLWPPTLVGVVATAGLALLAPPLLIWAAPMLLGLVLVVPIAVVTAAAGPSRWMRRRGLCAIPEDRDLPPLLADRARLAGAPAPLPDAPAPRAPAGVPVLAAAGGDD